MPRLQGLQKKRWVSGILCEGQGTSGEQAGPSLRCPYEILSHEVHAVYSAATGTLEVQVPNNHILTQNLCYLYYYPKPKYLITLYLDPLGNLVGRLMVTCIC